jgi:hypothetical protein
MSAIASFAEKLGVFEAITRTIRPEPAAHRLVTALKSLLEPYMKISDEIEKFLGLRFEGAPAEAQELHRIASSIEGGTLLFGVTRARAHCQTIRNLFERDLKPWFVTHESETKVSVITETVEELANFHNVTITELNELVRWLGEKVRNVEALLERKEYETANRLVRESRVEIRPQREAIVASMQKVLELDHKFLLASKAV